MVLFTIHQKHHFITENSTTHPKKHKIKQITSIVEPPDKALLERNRKGKRRQRNYYYSVIKNRD